MMYVLYIYIFCRMKDLNTENKSLLLHDSMFRSIYLLLAC